MRRHLPILLAMFALAGLSGCGGNSVDVDQANRYAGPVNQAQKDFAGTLGKLSAKVTPTSTRAQDDATLKSFQDAVTAVVGRLRAAKVSGQINGTIDQINVKLKG